MDDLISRQAAIWTVRKAKDKSEAHRMLIQLPTVDAVPVVHAHWIRHENADIVDGYLVPEFECSRCHSWKKDDSDYCPDCGAIMDGKNGNQA